MATDKKYFGRLKELAENMDGCFYYEFCRVDSEKDANPRVIIPNDNEMEAENGRERYEREKLEKARKKQELIGKLGGEELMKGLGKTDIELCFEIPLVKKCAFKEYDCVVKKGDMLILVYEDWEHLHSSKKVFVVETLDMRLMTHLEVKQKVMLRCGYEYDVIHKIIDCTEEKYKEILTPEAYALYQEQWKQMKKVEMS